MKIFLILLLALVLRLINLNQSFWLDEAAQVLESQNSISWLWHWMNADFNPPLFHFLIHFWSKLGNAEWFLRLPSVFFGVATIFFLYLLTKKLVNHNFAYLSSFFLAISPFHIYFSQEVRMYALFCFLSTVSMYFFIKSLKEDKLIYWIFSTIATILNFYTFYFSFFLLITQIVYFLFRFSLFAKFWKKFFLCVFFALGSFVFWLPKFLVQFEGGKWLTESLPGWEVAASTPVFKAPILILVKFFLGQISFENNYLYGLIIVFLMSLFFLLFIIAYNVKNKENFFFFFFWFAVPIFLAIIVSFWTPVIAPKRVILSLPPFLVLLTLGISVVKKQWQKFFILILLVVNFLSLGIYYFNPKFQRENWREAVSFVEKLGDQKSLALFEFSDPFAPYLWYQTGKIKASRAFDGVFALPNLVEEKLSKETKGIEKIFLFQYLADLTDPDSLVSKWLKNHGWVIRQTKDFSGVGFIYFYEKDF